MKRSFIIIFFLLATLSCKKFLQIDAPPDRLKSTLVFSNDVLANASVTGLYSSIAYNQNSFSSYSFSVFPGLSADELVSNYPNVNLKAFYENAVSVTSPTIGNYWTTGYQYIYHTNACLEGLARSASVSKQTKAQLEGEMKFVRAFIYFYLINVFGDVPLITTTDFRANDQRERTATVTVYQQIIADLEDAFKLMPAEYVSSGRARPNKFAAAALLARVYLYQRTWDKAIFYASEVINSGLYKLPTDLSRVFLTGSEEAIWQIVFSYPINVLESNSFLPELPATMPEISIAGSVMSIFEINDRRKALWIKQVINPSGVTYDYPFKYKVREPDINETESIMMLRFSEQYLIRAEAKAMQHAINESIDDLDKIRGRAGLSLIADTRPDVSEQALLELIGKERRCEFLAEWGHRWFDLKRTGQSGKVLSLIKQNWQETDTLYPIPRDQLLLNRSLVQNKGYTP